MLTWSFLDSVISLSDWCCSALTLTFWIPSTSWSVYTWLYDSYLSGTSLFELLSGECCLEIFHIFNGEKFALRATAPLLSFLLLFFVFWYISMPPLLGTSANSFYSILTSFVFSLNIWNPLSTKSSSFMKNSSTRVVFSCSDVGLKLFSFSFDLSIYGIETS